MNKPLLTIAIPTWNRSESLKTALEYLLPQIETYSEQIELIISDNNSEDQTQVIINDFLNKHHNLNIISNINTVNLGFYGNFRKCRELSSGKYIWILSDDDYVCSEVISNIIKELIESEFAVLYLKNNTSASSFVKIKLSRDLLISQESYNIGLISSVIFLNNKDFDEKLFKEYNKSAFIGFIFLLNSFNFDKRVIIIEGNCLNTANDLPKGYNFFNVFVDEMNHVINYMRVISVPNNIIKIFRSTYLKNFLCPYYIQYKTREYLHFGKCDFSSFKTINTSINKSYSDLNIYWFYFFPLTILPRFIISLLRFSRRKVRNIFSL